MTLKEMRMNAGYSQARLAQLSGINLRSLQDYEQGHKSIASAKGETLYRLSQVLGYSIENILVGSGVQIDVWESSEARMAERILAYEKGLAHQRKASVRFPVIVSDDTVDMGRIYPTKQKMVKSIIDELRGDRKIEEVRLFGSSITMRCNKDSDIDLAVELKDPSLTVRNDISERIQLCCDWGADILWMDRVTPTDRVYENIMKGLVLL